MIVKKCMSRGAKCFAVARTCTCNRMRSLYMYAIGTEHNTRIWYSTSKVKAIMPSVARLMPKLGASVGSCVFVNLLLAVVGRYKHGGIKISRCRAVYSECIYYTVMNYRRTFHRSNLQYNQNSHHRPAHNVNQHLVVLNLTTDKRTCS